MKPMVFLIPLSLIALAAIAYFVLGSLAGR
jgi:hypothetical protein